MRSSYVPITTCQSFDSPAFLLIFRSIQRKHRMQNTPSGSGSENFRIHTPDHLTGLSIFKQIYEEICLYENLIVHAVHI